MFHRVLNQPLKALSGKTNAPNFTFTYVPQVKESLKNP